MEARKNLLMSATLCNVVVFAVVMVVNAAAGGLGVNWGWFHNTTAEISRKYPSDITPTPETFSIWGVIYLYQVVWIVYSLTLLCRRSKGGYLYYSPCFIPLSFYVLFWLNMACNVSWLFIWDREFLYVAVPVLFLTAIFLIFAIAISMSALANSAQELIQQGKSLELAFVRCFIHNGVGMYATWTAIASHVGLSSTLVYRDPFLSMNAACITCVGLLAGVVVLYTVLDNFVIDKHTRYLFTPYVVLLWALSGIIERGFDPERNSSIIVGLLLVYALVAFIVKVVLVIVRSCRNPEPLNPNRNYKPIM